MSDVPPNNDASDDIDERYRRASALSPSRPSDSVRRAVLAHAAELAAHRRIDPRAASPRRTWWRPALIGTLAAAALAGLLITPYFLPPRAPLPEVTMKPAAEAPAPAVASRTGTDNHHAPVNVTGPGAAPPVAAPPPVATAPPVAAAPPAVAQSAAAPAVAAQRGADAAGELRAPSSSASMRALAVPPAAALWHAAEIGDLPRLQALLGTPIDINARDANGRTALILAISHAQAGAVDALLAHGADPNLTDSGGITPLQAAEAGGEPSIVEALQRAGAH